MTALITRTLPLLCLLLIVFAYPAAAKIPGNTSDGAIYSDPETGQDVHIQNLYTVHRVITGRGLPSQLSSPSDVYIAANDHVFVADTGNQRIVELDDSGLFLQAIGDAEGEGSLKDPEGVFVSREGTIYVADTGNSRVAVFSPQGDFLRSYGKPETELLPANFYFVPKKIAVDDRGVMYVASKGSYQGLLRIDSQGEFKGFFGANRTTGSWLDTIKRKFYTKEQLQKELSNHPIDVANLSLDRSGFILTVNGGVGIYSGQIKRLNSGGIDLLRNKSLSYANHLVSAVTDPHDFIYALDREKGRIIIYSPEGDVLFRFGQLAEGSYQEGMFRYPTGIAINSRNELWVADGQMNVIQVFQRTDFGDAVLTGAALYEHGYYDESKPYWEKVKLENDLITLQFRALGKIALTHDQYGEALKDFKKSKDIKGYSDAYWALRMNWIKQYFVLALASLAIAYVLLRYAVKRMSSFARKRTWPYFLRQAVQVAKNAGYAMVHPYEGFYRLKERKVSYYAVFLLLFGAALAHLARLYGTGFIFHPVDLADIHVWTTLLLYFALWLTWVFANYLVSAIMDGEGRLGEVVQASAYALAPYILFSIPVVLLSNFLVYDERVILSSIQEVLWIWEMVLFFIMTQVIQNFDFMETVKKVLVMLLATALIWVFMVIMSGLTFNLYDFFYQFYREVTLRGL